MEAMVTWMVRNSHGKLVESPVDDPRTHLLNVIREAIADAWLDGYQNGAGDPYFSPSSDEEIEQRAKAYAAEELP